MDEVVFEEQQLLAAGPITTSSLLTSDVLADTGGGVGVGVGVGVTLGLFGPFALPPQQLLSVSGPEFAAVPLVETPFCPFTVGSA